MMQYRGSLNNFFINSANKLKNKQGEAQPHPVLNLKKTYVFFSKQQNNENIYLKKPNAVFVNTSCFFLIMLLVVFIELIRQKVFKKDCFLYKNTIKKEPSFSKNTSVLIKNITCVFLQQQMLKQQQK